MVSPELMEKLIDKPKCWRDGGKVAWLVCSEEVEVHMEDPVRSLLKNFIPIGTRQYTALVSREPRFEEFAENVKAAATAATMGLKSVDYAKRKYSYRKYDLYSADAVLQEELEVEVIDAYIAAYDFAHSYVMNCINSLNTEGKPSPSAGELTASVALHRLVYSFFCAHLMYQLGHRYEGHAISRLILEQLAWAYAANKVQGIEIIQNISATKAITKLKELSPQAGALYGFLSNMTHISYLIHPEFLRHNNDRVFVIHSHSSEILPECGAIILLLGDLFGLVYEVSQFQYIPAPQAIEQMQGMLFPKPNREYLARMQDYLRNIDEAAQDAYHTSSLASPIMGIFGEWSA